MRVKSVFLWYVMTQRFNIVMSTEAETSQPLKCHSVFTKCESERRNEESHDEKRIVFATAVLRVRGCFDSATLRSTWHIRSASPWEILRVRCAPHFVKAGWQEKNKVKTVWRSKNKRMRFLHSLRSVEMTNIICHVDYL